MLVYNVHINNSLMTPTQNVSSQENNTNILDKVYQNLYQRFHTILCICRCIHMLRGMGAGGINVADF